MEKVVSILITVALLVAQHYLSSRKQWIWGGIIPALYTIFAIWFKISKAPTFQISLLIIVGVVLLSIWAEGRETYKRKMRKEMKKMKSNDIL